MLLCMKTKVPVKLDASLDRETEKRAGPKGLDVEYEAQVPEGRNDICRGVTQYGCFTVTEERKIRTVARYDTGILAKTERQAFLYVGYNKLFLLPFLLLLLSALAILAALFPGACSTAAAAEGGESLNTRGTPVPPVAEILAGTGDVNAGGIDWSSLSENSVSELSFSVNVAPIVSVSSGEGDFMLVNPENNKLAIIAEIYLEDDTLIYRSPILPPYTHINKGKTLFTPDEGEYNAICYLNGVTNEEEPKLIGTIGVEMLITVK